MIRSDERGIAMVVALFMVLMLSVLGSSLVFVSRTETLSSLNYKTMSQTRYAAESGIHRAANHLLWTYVPPSNPAQLALFDITQSPVRVVANGRPVVLTNTVADSNYPDAGQTVAFVAASQGALGVNVGTVAYRASALLLAMRQIPDPFFPGQWITLQTWQITGTGSVGGAGSAEVEVSAIVERQAVPIYKYAAFATDPGCDALRFGGGADTNSYDSGLYGGAGLPPLDNWGGNVGTNGNMNEIGSTTVIHGSLSTPRTGVGACNGGNGGSVPALTVSGGATVDGGIVELPQAVPFPTPPVPNPLPPTGNQTFNGGCAAGTAAFCSVAGGVVTIDPSLVGGTVTLADVRVQGGMNLHLKPGVYIVNSVSFSGNSTLTLDTSVAGSVVVQVAGQNSNTPIDFTGGSISNPTYDPSRFQIFYAGDKNVKLTGGASSAALVYAPNASTSFGGGGNFYGAVVSGKVTDMGGASIHYDRNLDKEALAAGNPTMGSFTWRSF
jgi:PilX N-terminal